MNCGYVSEFIDNPSTGINALIVFALAFISLVLAINYFFAIARMYRKIRERYIEKEKELRTRAESHQISFKKIALKNQKYIQTL
jgi:Tfp pilus assembly protein PilO